MGRYPQIEVLAMGPDPWVASRAFASRRIEVLCLSPMEPVRLIEFRRAIMASHTQQERFRTSLLVDQADSAIVYHAIGFGYDDVIESSVPDDELAEQLLTFAENSGRACASRLVRTVDLPAPVIRGTVAYADDVDRKIVRLVAVGYTDREIGEIMHFSHQVIRNRISQLMLRSGLRNRTQLAARHTFESTWPDERIYP